MLFVRLKKPCSRSARRSTRPPAFRLRGRGCQDSRPPSPKQQQEGDEEEEVEVELLVSKNGGLHLKASALDEEEAKVLEAEARVARLDEGNILEAESSLHDGLSLIYDNEMRVGVSSDERNGCLLEE